MFCEDGNAQNVERCSGIVDASGDEVLIMTIKVVGEPELHGSPEASFDLWSIRSQDSTVLRCQIASEEGAHIASDTVGSVVNNEGNAVGVKRNGFRGR